MVCFFLNSLFDPTNPNLISPTPSPGKHQMSQGQGTPMLPPAHCEALGNEGKELNFVAETLTLNPTHLQGFVNRSLVRGSRGRINPEYLEQQSYEPEVLSQTRA